MPTYTGIVIRAHACAKSIKVRVPKQVWNKKLQKNFTKYENFFSHDGNEACKVGDVVKITSGYRSSSTKRFIVTEIVSPFGDPEPRKPVQTIEEWVKEREDRRIRRGKSVVPRDGAKVEGKNWWEAEYTGKEAGAEEESIEQKIKGLRLEEAGVEGTGARL